MLAEQPIVTQINGLRAYQGGFFRVLVSPEQTDGNLAIIDTTLPKGSEPPKHVHTREDETFYIIEGSVQFEIGDTVINGEVGQAVFAPRNIEHQFTIQTDKVRMLTVITPGDFVNFFLEFSQPIADEPIRLQAPQGPPPAELLARLVTTMNSRFGVQLA